MLVKTSSVCNLMQDPFSLHRTLALAKVLVCWGSRFTWIVQRELAPQVIGEVESHEVDASFLSFAVGRGGHNTVPRIRCGLRAWHTNCCTGDPIMGLDITDRNELG
jgi:hypothetical protein